MEEVGVAGEVLQEGVALVEEGLLQDVGSAVGRGLLEGEAGEDEVAQGGV